MDNQAWEALKIHGKTDVQSGGKIVTNTLSHFKDIAHMPGNGIEPQLVALKKVAQSFSHFTIEHWIPAQQVHINLHNSFCPDCWVLAGVAWASVLQVCLIYSGLSSPVPPPNSRPGDAASLISPIPSLISNSSASSALSLFFAGAREQFQEALGHSVFIDKRASTMLSFFSSDKREIGSNEDISEASE